MDIQARLTSRGDCVSPWTLGGWLIAEDVGAQDVPADAGKVLDVQAVLRRHPLPQGDCRDGQIQMGGKARQRACFAQGNFKSTMTITSFPHAALYVSLTGISSGT